MQITDCKKMKIYAVGFVMAKVLVVRVGKSGFKTIGEAKSQS